MNRQICTGCLMAAALSLFATVSSAGIVDGGFETGNTPGTGFSDVWDPHATFANNVGVSQTLNSDTPQAGNWFAFFGDGIPISNFIDQSVSTNIGDAYTLTFWVAIQPDSVSDGNSFDSHDYAPQVDVGFTGNGFDDIIFPTSEVYTQAYTMYTEHYVATAGSSTLEFAAVDDYGTALLLDSITLTDNGAVAPEPGTLVLAGAGLMLAGLCRKLKRS